MCTLLVLSRVANFTRHRYIKMQGPCIIAFRPNLRPQFFVRTISPLIPEPKMLPRSRKTKQPTHASTRTRLLRRGPARPSSTPTNPTAARIIGFLQEDEGEADLQWRRFQKMICSGDTYTRVT